MRKEDLQDEVLNKLRELPNFDELKFVYLFGSEARGDTTPRSDVDICIYYDIENRKELREQLYTVSGSFSEKYDISMFQLLPLTVQKKVFEGELLYTSDKEFVHELARRTYQEYEDFKPRRDRIIRGKMGKADV